MNNLKSVLDGARVLDGTNSTPDIKQQSVNGSTNINSTSQDMVGHMEFLVNAQMGTLGASSNAVLAVQESNEAAANFTNISGATLTLDTTNTSLWLSVNWRHPDRKRYVRLQLRPAVTNATPMGAVGIRLQPKSGPVNLDSSMTQVSS